MQKLLTGLIDLLFPPSTGGKLLRDITPENLRLLHKPSIFGQIEYLSQYSESVIQAAIIENKFHNNKSASKILGILFNEWEVKQDKNIIYIPIPLGEKRLRERGHNQVETFLKLSNAKSKINTCLLKRVVETTPQSHLDKNARQKNMRGVFSFTGEKIDIASGTKIILVDDVVTTGATLMAARATLAPHLPQNTTLTCLALAH
jgi:ComF family protein